LLAVFEDGFTQVRQISTTISENKNKSTSIEANAGITNLFGLLGMSLSGKRSGSSDAGSQEVIANEKIHTPTSLLNKLRIRLIEERLLHFYSETIPRDQVLETGDFIEIKAVLRKNPMVDIFEAIVSLFQLASSFSEEVSTEVKPNVGGGRKVKLIQKTDSTKRMEEQFNTMLNAVNAGDSLDLLGELIPKSDYNLVLNTQIECFLNRDIKSILDGEYRVFGRIVKHIHKGENERINLLRKTTFSRLDDNLFIKLKESFSGAEAAGIILPEIKTTISAPAIQMIPIAIYV